MFAYQCVGKRSALESGAAVDRGADALGLEVAFALGVTRTELVVGADGAPVSTAGALVTALGATGALAVIGSSALGVGPRLAAGAACALLVGVVAPCSSPPSRVMP
jgi:hypothetical protein